jgi:hypothetical protein
MGNLVFNGYITGRVLSGPGLWIRIKDGFLVELAYPVDVVDAKRLVLFLSLLF